MRHVVLLTLIASSAFCASVSVGVKAGVPLTDAFSAPSSYSFGTRRYLVGGTAEVHLPFRLSIELDALYKRIGYDFAFRSVSAGYVYERTTANQWEFPLLAKYEIAGGPVRPFIDAGPVLRHLSGFHDVYEYRTYFPPTSGTVTSNNPPLLSNRNSPGFAVGGGVTLKLFRIRVSPEIRYTHWGNEAFGGALETPHGSLRSVTNQTDLIVGFAF